MAERAIVGDLRLGWRLATAAGGRSWLRLVLSAVAGLAAALLLSAAFAVNHAIDAQHARQRALGAYDVPHPDASDPLLMTLYPDSYHGEEMMVRAVIVRGDDPPCPPGVRAWPGPGEMVVSPALATALRSDTSLRQRYPQRVVGTIGSAGVLSPGEYRAYIGVAAFPGVGADSSLDHVAGFGDDPYDTGPHYSTGGPAEGWADSLTTSRIYGLLVALYVLLPLAVFVGLATRLSATGRDRRLAVLRVIGFSARRCQLINAVETVLATGVGSVAGIVLFLLLRGTRDGWWVGPLSAWSADLTLSAPQVLVLLLGVPCYAALVSAVAVGPALRDPFGRVRRQPHRPSRARIAVLAAGVLLLAAQVVVGPPDPSTSPLAYLKLIPAAVGAVLVLAGLVLTLPSLLRVVGGGMARTRWLPVRLGAAGLRHDAPAATRVLTGVLAALCIGGVGAVLSGSIGVHGTPSHAFVGQTIANTVLGPLDAATADRLRAVPGVRGLALVHAAELTANGDFHGSALIGTCRDVRTLYSGAGSCTDGAMYRIDSIVGDYGETLPEPVPHTELTAHDSDKATVTVPADAPSLRLRERTNEGAEWAAVITVAALPADWHTAATDRRTTMLIDGGVPAANRVRAVLSAHDPAAHLQGPMSVRRALSATTLVPILTALAAITWSLGGLALLVAAIDDALRRRRQVTELQVVGLPLRTLRLAHLVRLWLPLAAGGAFAVLATLAAGAGALLALGKPPSMMVASLPPMLAGLAVLAALLLLPAALGAGARVHPESLHRE